MSLNITGQSVWYFCTASASKAIVVTTSGIYHDISLTTGLYVIYGPVVSFDLRCQSGIYSIKTKKSGTMEGQRPSQELPEAIMGWN